MAIQQEKGFSSWETALLPQEEMLETGRKKRKLIIGIPREDHDMESRVGLTPEAVELLVNQDHEVYIETGAGRGANYLDTDYSENGGQIVDKTEVFQCDIILKIAPLTLKEIDLLKGKNQMVISSLQFNSYLEPYIRKLMAKKIIAIAFEKIQEDNYNYPVERTMNTISGKAAILIAAEYLSNQHKGKGVMLGGITGITPTEVVILGGGYAAESAIRAALGLGAFVKVFDSSIMNLRKLQEKIGQDLYTSIFHPRVLEKAIRSTEVLIAAMDNKDERPKCIITEDMIRSMKKGSVIVDISIDQVQCIETSEIRDQKAPVFVKHGVIHHCMPNLPSRVARTASIALSNIFAPMLLEMGETGGMKQYLKEGWGFRKGIYIYNGILTNGFIGNYFDIPFKDIDLLLAAF